MKGDGKPFTCYYKGNVVPQNATIDYFNELSCPIKEKLQTDLEAAAIIRKDQYNKTVNSISALNRTHSTLGGHRGRQ